MKTLREHLPILSILTAINIFLLWRFISDGEALHGVGYFIFFYVAVSAIYFFTKRVPPQIATEVKEPKKELAVAVLFSLLGIVFLVLNQSMQAKTPPVGWMFRLPVVAGMFFFMLPLGILLYLLFKKYRLSQLGLPVKPAVHLLLGLLVWGLTGLFAVVFNKSGILWGRAFEELGGIAGIIIQGIIGAALVEEFSRFVIQSRFEKVVKTAGLNILFATTIWAFMHFPVTYHKSEEVFGTLIYCIQIIPLGFIWGYLTQRTKSILPAVLAHGLNLWGLQNG